jgi:8-oxo-dGTP pyrophosphatase MutT (NUDIX family)
LRVFYRAAYLAARIWWFVTRPETSGSLVALWCDGRLLLVRTSYRPLYSLPGGFKKKHETSLAAAERELLEELGIAVTTGLHHAWHGTVTFEHRLDTVTIWEASVDAMPSVVVDGLEVVWAGWKTADEALALPLLPSIEQYLTSRRQVPFTSS